MTSSAPPDVAALVEQFFRRRGEGRRVSVDDVLAEAGAHPDAQGRAALIDTISRRARRSSFRTTISLEPSQGGAADAPEFALAEIPGYDLIEEIGRGGMGAVYEAYQQSTGRRVAVKLISEHIAGNEAARRRFEREVELVARLQHPSIVSVLDSGVHQGRYFYVMEYVEGTSLDAYLRNAETLVTAERAVAGPKRRYAETKDVLRLVAKICDAVEYAHQRGVMHRDLKPSNILVVDEKELRTEDSGLSHDRTAGILHSVLSAQPKILDFGLAKDIDPLAVEPRALTLTEPGQIIGTLAYMAPEQARGAHDEISVRSDVYSLGAIAYEAVTGRLPCSVNGALHEVLDRIQRQDPPRPSMLRKGIAPDLDAILLKALEKVPQCRYPTIGDLAADIRRFLDHRPILARRAGPATRVARWIRRNRSVAAVGGLAIILIVGVTIVSFIRIVDERDKSRTEAHKSAQISEFLQNMLATLDPEVARGRDTTLLREMLEKAAKQVESELGGQPLVEEALRHTIGTTYVALGLYDDAEPHLRIALEISKRQLGETHPDTAIRMGFMAQLLGYQGKLAEAEWLFTQSIEILRRVRGDEDPGTIAMAEGLGDVLRNEGRFSEAEAILRRTLEISRRARGEDYSDTLRVMGNLASVLRDEGKFSEAENLLQDALEALRRALGLEHPDSLVMMGLLANLLYDQGRLGEAETLYREALAVRRRVLGDEHPGTLTSTTALAVVLRDQGNLEEAQRLFSQALAAWRRVMPEGDWRASSTRGHLGKCLLALQRYEEAEGYLLESYTGQRAVFGDQHKRTVNVLRSLIELYDAWGKADKAAEWRAKLAEGQVSTQPASNDGT